MRKAPKFNVDLLMHRTDLDDVKILYPHLVPWVHWSDLVDQFKIYDHRAKFFKQRVESFGLFCIWAAFCSSLIIAINPLFEDFFPQSNTSCARQPILGPECLAYFSIRYGWIILFFTSVYFASRAISAPNRTNWLEARLSAERLRQLYFQHLLFWFFHLCSSDESDRQLALKSRNPSLKAALVRTDNRQGPALSKTISDIEKTNWEIADRLGAAPTGELDSNIARDLLQYLADRRFKYQTDHALRMLSDTEDRKSPSVHRKLLLRNGTLTGLSLLFLFSQVLAGAFYLVEDLSAQSGWRNSADELSSIFATVAVIFAALALAIRSIGNGARLESDVVRYRTYAGIGQRISRKVESGDLKTAAGQMRIVLTAEAFEELSYWEMREFLALHAGARFNA